MKVKEFDLAWDDFSDKTLEAFIDRFMEPRNIFIDIGPGVGLAAGFNVRPRLDMVLHLIMFDKRLRGREDLLKGIMKHFFDKLQLRRMTCIIGSDARTGIKLVERLGFVHEGTLRQGLLRGGKYLDAEVFGMLSEELQEA